MILHEHSDTSYLSEIAALLQASNIGTKMGNINGGKFRMNYINVNHLVRPYDEINQPRKYNTMHNGCPSKVLVLHSTHHPMGFKPI